MNRMIQFQVIINLSYISVNNWIYNIATIAGIFATLNTAYKWQTIYNNFHD